MDEKDDEGGRAAQDVVDSDSQALRVGTNKPRNSRMTKSREDFPGRTSERPRGAQLLRLHKLQLQPDYGNIVNLNDDRAKHGQRGKYSEQREEFPRLISGAKKRENARRCGGKPLRRTTPAEQQSNEWHKKPDSSAFEKGAPQNAG
ncbi:MAG TPA: hypothetical protein VHY79_19305 [Rhizomicrobium sp.]|nr:hypothetical protein [Rhizomicrobium sp.]